MRRRVLLTALFGVACGALAAHADLPSWQQVVVSASAIEAALFRVMQLPSAQVMYPRPPQEAAGALDKLLAAKPADPELYALRAHTQEQALNFAAAERDWISFVTQSPDKAAANRQLADFFARRLMGSREIGALETAAAGAAPATEAFLPADRQAAWGDFRRALAVADRQALGPDAELAVYTAWIARYPAEPAARAQAILAMLRLGRPREADAAITAYRQAFPKDAVFPVKASALVAASSGGPDAASRALAIYDAAYQPLWPVDLASGYFALLESTHNEHTMLANARAALTRNPDDLAAVTRLIRFCQQTGRTDAVAATIAQYRVSKEARHATWSADELYTFASLLGQSGLAEEAARYDFALESTPGPLHLSGEPSAQLALAGVIDLLLQSPDKPIALGAGNLVLYRDLATVDTGPGYWNGILSLWLNSADPAAEMRNEEGKAAPYFHRAKAADLLTVLDGRFPAAPERDPLHAALIRAYAAYGEDDAVIAAGSRFLTDFPHSPAQLDIALAVADADARKGDTAAEFALYQSLLNSFAQSLGNMPLTAGGATDDVSAPTTPAAADPQVSPDLQTPATLADTAPNAEKPTAAELLLQSLQMPVRTPATASPAAAYRQVLERYLGRLTATNQVPAALAVLRRELDRNPDDPRLYDRLASFLEQNDLSAQDEQVYQAAIRHFNAPGFYNKLARFYLHTKRRQDFAALTRKVTDIFSGTELESYFSNVDRTWPQLFLELNLYAHTRFPHDLRFTRNLLIAYGTKGTADANAREKLLREHWWEASDLETDFFEHLSRTRKLTAELAQLQSLAPANASGSADATQSTNLAATRELAGLQLWQSHFEQAAPLLAQLAQAYPGDPAIGDPAASLFRSLSYHDPTQIAHAVAIQQNLAAAEPANLDRLAAIGDTYANSTSPELNLSASAQLAQAVPYWARMSTVQRGTPDGYLQAATVFWDYFQFDKASQQIQAARKQFGQPTLYGFEAGALDEDMGQPALAIDEYTRAAAAEQAPLGSDPVDNLDPAGDESTTQAPGSGATARDRLLVFARRPGTAVAVDTATARLLTQTHSLGALQLRVDVLRAQGRQAEISTVVQGAIHAATRLDQVTQLAALSQRERLPRAYTQALEREVSLAPDPVERVEFQYGLVHAYEDGENTAAAQRVVESVYRDQPKILGVVRTTVDFYWDHKQPKRAVDTLVKASSQANAALAHDFTLEATAKSNSSGDFARSRALMRPLLAANPFNARYLSLAADSYALAHDDAGLRDLYLKTIAAVGASSLTPADKRVALALARRGIIPALTDLKDYSGAVDQCIALLQAFPEDADVLQQAALYARRYGREPQLLAFLTEAVADSPRDSRFAIDLGRVDELFGDGEGALAAYSKAISIRQDRPDLYIAHANLEEHRGDFEAACADYARLFTLTYDDPQWMQKAALARVRQGKPNLAVTSLETAWITSRPASPLNAFRVAAQLEQWNLLAEARTFAERGIAMAGDDLLGDPKFADGVKTYTTILARERNAPDLLTKLLAWSRTAHLSPSGPTALVQQAQVEGIAALTDAQWREARARRRDAQAQKTFSDALGALGGAVATFYTPEEKLAYAKLLDARRAPASRAEVASVWIPAAHEAGLLDREAAWRRNLLLGNGELGRAQLQPLIELEQRRVQFAALASTLDTYVEHLPPNPDPQQRQQQRVSVLNTAVESWRSAGDTSHELRDLRSLVLSLGQTQWAERLFALLLRGDTPALLALAAANGPSSDAAANYAFAHGSPELAFRAVSARAQRLPPVWQSTNTALAGLYLREVTPRSDGAFRSALDDVSIGERLAHKPDPHRTLTGQLWFALGTRYGVYRTLMPAASGDPEDFLASALEGSSDSPQAQLQLARAYLDAQEGDAAIVEFRHALELDSSDPTPSIAIGKELWAEGKHPEAVVAWRDALVQLRNLVEERSEPESFWLNFDEVAGIIRDHSLNADLDPALSNVLGAYVHKNGGYRTAELLHSAYLSRREQGEQAAAKYVLSFVPRGQNQRTILEELADTSWYPHAQLGLLYQRELSFALANRSASGTSDDADAIRAKYLGWSLETHQLAGAQQLLEGVPTAKRSDAQFLPYTLQLAARQSRLEAMISAWTTDPAAAPDVNLLRNAAEQLRRNGEVVNSRALLEYLFTRKLDDNSLQATDFLALAEARLDAGDTPSALDLLHRFTAQADDVYSALQSAAHLLLHSGHHAEAMPFLQTLADGTPWDLTYRQELGQAERKVGQTNAANDALSRVATSTDAPYALRAEAATSLRPLSGPHRFTSGELTLLAGAAAPTPQAADQPFYVYARIAVASTAPAALATDLLHHAIAVAPEALLPRLQLALFYAELKGKRHEQASAAIQPLLTRYPSLLQRRASSASSDAATPPCFDDPCAAPAETLPGDLIEVADRRKLLLALGDLHERQHDPAQAIQLLQAATDLSATDPGSDPGSAARKARIADLEDKLARQRENDARRPVLQATLADSSYVEPMLPSGSPLPQSLASKGQP